MKHLLTCLAILSLIPATFAVTPTGAAAPELPSPVWLDKTPRKLADQYGKKFAVLYIWNMDQHALSDFPAAIAAAKECASLANFVSVGNGEEADLRKFPGVANLPFPVNADHKQATNKLFVRSFDRLPLAVVIGKDGKIIWRGSVSRVSAVIRQIAAGKFDLKENIRVEQFSTAVGDAIREKDHAKALKLVHDEWALHPDNFELLSIQLTLLCKRLNRVDDAFALIAEARKKTPAAPQVYELEYRLINNTGKDKKELMKEFLPRMLTALADQPEVLMGFAAAEMDRKPADFDPSAICTIAAAGWKSKGFRDDAARGMYAIQYAKILHGFGRPDLALKLAKQAYSLLKGHERQREGAKGAAIYYQKLIHVAPSLRLE